MFKVIVAVLVIGLAFFIVHRMNTNKKDAAENIQKGQVFLEQNKQKEGVKTTESGLQYLVLTEGEGESLACSDGYFGRLVESGATQ